MRWTPENDCKLYPFLVEREIAPWEYAIIARLFPGMCIRCHTFIHAWELTYIIENSTPKAIGERIVRLRAKAREMVERYGIYPYDESRHPPKVNDDRVSNASETPAPSESDVAIADGITDMTALGNPAARATAKRLEQDRRSTIDGFRGFTSVNQGKKRPASTIEIDDDETAALDRTRASTGSMAPPARKKQRKSELEPKETFVPNSDWLMGLDPNAAPRSGDPINRRNASMAAGGAEIAPTAPGEQGGGVGAGAGVGVGGEEVGGLPPTEQGEGGAAGAGAGREGHGVAETSQEDLEAADALLDLHRKDSRL
jgi:hypothetical protein